MINLLVTVIILAIVAGLLYWLVTLLPLPAPFPQIIQVAVVLICFLLLLGILFGGVDVPVMRLR
jgi:cation transporter-like permease